MWPHELFVGQDTTKVQMRQRTIGAPPGSVVGSGAARRLAHFEWDALRSAQPDLVAVS